MQSHAYVALVTLLALIVPVWMGFRTAVARRACGLAAPAMSGDPILERHLRVHGNTLEWLPVFLVSMWLFAIYWNDLVAAALGLVWILARILYAYGYVADPGKRAAGFAIQFLVTAILLFGALGRIIWILSQGMG